MKQFAARCDWSDLVRLVVVIVLSCFVGANGEALSKGVALVPSSIDQPWITKPAKNEEVAAGMVAFEGTGPDGQVEILENGRIVCAATVVGGKWSASGKLFGEGKTAVFVRAIGGKSLQSPSLPLTVKGKAPRFLSITNPLDGDYLVPGKVTIKGLGKAGDEVTLTYADQVVGVVTVDSSGAWSKEIELYQPREEAFIRATSKGETEIAVVVVQGTG